MPVIDVDAHFHEPLDWIEVTDPDLAKELGEPLRFMDAGTSLFSVRSKKFKDIGKAVEANGGIDTVTPGMQEHLQMTDDRQPEQQNNIADDPHCGMQARLKFCDENGIDIQLLNPSFHMSAYVQAGRMRRPDLIPRIRRCWNTWAANLVEGYTDRMMPIAQIDLTDIPTAIKEMTEMRKAGSRAFSFGQSLVEQGGGQLAKSVSHPDFAPVWSAAEDLGMAAIAHVGFGSERINAAWANNGTDDYTSFSDLYAYILPQLAPQLLIGSMVMDGVFERHPKLALIVQEVGISWLPHLCDQLDLAAGKMGRMPRPEKDGEYRPTFEKSNYRLPLAPTEYMERNVWVTPLVASEPLAPTIDIIPNNILCFSSDYPHVEGTADAVALCEKQMGHLSAAARADFYGGVGKMIGL